MLNQLLCYKLPHLGANNFLTFNISHSEFLRYPVETYQTSIRILKDVYCLVVADIGQCSLETNPRYRGTQILFIVQYTQIIWAIIEAIKPGLKGKIIEDHNHSFHLVSNPFRECTSTTLLGKTQKILGISTQSVSQSAAKNCES